MIATRTDYFISTSLLSVLAFGIIWLEQQQPPSSTADAAESPVAAAFVSGDTTPPEPMAKDEPAPEPKPAELAEAAPEDPGMTRYQGGGDRAPSPPTPSVSEVSAPAAETPLPTADVPAAIAVVETPPAASEEAESEKTVTGSAENKVAGELSTEGVDAPSYSIRNLDQLLRELVSSGHALAAVQDSNGELYYTTDLAKPEFRLVVHPSNVARFALGRMVRFPGVHEWVRVCAKKFPISSTAEARVYFSGTLDAYILSAQKEEAARLGLPLHALLRTSGRFDLLPGGGLAFIIEDVALR